MCIYIYPFTRHIRSLGSVAGLCKLLPETLRPRRLVEAGLCCVGVGTGGHGKEVQVVNGTYIDIHGDIDGDIDVDIWLN